MREQIRKFKEILLNKKIQYSLSFFSSAIFIDIYSRFSEYYIPKGSELNFLQKILYEVKKLLSWIPLDWLIVASVCFFLMYLMEFRKQIFKYIKSNLIRLKNIFLSKKHTHLTLEASNLVKIINSYNVSSITDVGVGSYIINFITPLKPEYFVNVISDKSLKWEEIERTPDKYHISFKEGDPGRIKILFDEET